jgi:hypothetical protein
MKKYLLLVLLLVSMGVDAQVLTAPTNFQDSIQTIVKLGKAKPNDADLNSMIDLFSKKVEDYNKEQATLPMNIRERRRLQLEELYEQIIQSYQASYGNITFSTNSSTIVSPTQQNLSSDFQSRNLPSSLVGKVYYGKVATSNPEYDSSYDCHYIIAFCSENRCRVFGRLIQKGTKAQDLSELAVVSELESGARDFEYSYQNGQLKIINDTGSMLLQDGGRKIKMIDDNALHGDIYLLDDEQSRQVLNIVGYNGKNFVNTIDYNHFIHRGYDGKVVRSDFSRIQKLLNEDVAGYYNISEFATEVQKKVFAQSEDYKNIYYPRLKKEKEYLLQDEFEVIFFLNETGADAWNLEYDMSSKRFHFELRHNENDRYKLSSENNNFHVLVSNGREASYCLTYPKSLVSVVNGRSYNGKMGQKQTLYTGIVPEIEAAKYYPNRHNVLLWRFKIEKMKDGRVYGKSTGLRVVEGNYREGTNITGFSIPPEYRTVNRKDEIKNIVLDFTNSLTQKGNTFKSVKTIK